MSLTAQERDRLTGMWRDLARRTRHFAADPAAPHPEFMRLALDAREWKSPREDFSESFLLFGFARLTSALARARIADMAAMGRATAHVAEVVADMLGPDPELDAPAQAWWADH